MALHLYITKDDQGISVHLTGCRNLVEVRQWMDELGAEEEEKNSLICLVTHRGEAANAVSALMKSCHEDDHGIGRLIETAMADMFARGVEYGRKHPK